MDTKNKLYLLRRETSGGGAERTVQRYIKAFEHDYDVRHIAAGLQIENTHIEGEVGSSWRKALNYARSANNFMDKNPADVVISLERGTHCHIYRAGDGVHQKWVSLRHGRSLKKYFNPLHWILPRLEAFTLKDAVFVVANSRMVAEELSAYYPEIRSKVVVIHNGVDPEIFYQTERKGELKAEYGIPKGAQMLLFAGGDWNRKGLDAALRITASLKASIRDRNEPDPQLVVVGHGKPKHYHRTIQTLGLEANVQFSPPTPSIAGYYRAADLFILPTLYDPFSNACLEALASGCPVITTRSNGASEIITHKETGYILDGNDYEAAAHWWMNHQPLASTVADSVKDMTLENEHKQLNALVKQLTLPLQ